MRTSKALTLVVAAVMALSVIGPAAAADGGLSVTVTQEGDDVTVSVTHNNSSVDGASVAVETDGNYSEAGNYTTDDEGVVELSAPDSNLTVDVTATYDNDSASTTADLVGEDVLEDENETEDNETGPPTVDLNVTFANGTFDFSNVTVNDSQPFGLYMTSFVSTAMDTNTSQPMGLFVADFATTFNPGNAPDHAGPPENKTRGPPENKTQGPPENKTRGPPENKTQGPPENKTRGPPDDAGPGGNGGGPPAVAESSTTSDVSMSVADARMVDL